MFSDCLCYPHSILLFEYPALCCIAAAYSERRGEGAFYNSVYCNLHFNRRIWFKSGQRFVKSNIQQNLQQIGSKVICLLGCVQVLISQGIACSVHPTYSLTDCACWKMTGFFCIFILYYFGGGFTTPILCGHIVHSKYSACISSQLLKYLLEKCVYMCVLLF